MRKAPVVFIASLVAVSSLVLLSRIQSGKSGSDDSQGSENPASVSAGRPDRAALDRLAPGNGAADATPAASTAGGARAAEQDVAAAETLKPLGSAWSGLASSTESPSGRFREWVSRYERAGTPEAKAALEEEGVRLASERRAEMRGLIQRDPQRALELAVPLEVRDGLPASIDAQLEKRISGRGDLSVLAAYPAPGFEDGFVPVRRTLTFEGMPYQAFVFGARIDQPSRKNLPVTGLSIDNVVALGEPVRVLETWERLRLKERPAADAICGVSARPVTIENDETPVEVGGEIRWLCGVGHSARLNQQLRLAASGGTGSAGDGGVAQSPYTEGRKRVVMFRVAFSNLQTPDISSNSLVAVHAGVDSFWRASSYGQTVLAGLGAGSDIIQVNLPNPVAAYDGDPDGLRADVRARATAQGVDLTKYDFDVIYTASGRPSFDFGGLGYVGAPGAWVVSASVSTTSHEMGHNLGNPHANFWDTGGITAIGTGDNLEYGDPFDVMGGGSASGAAAGHYVAKFKWKIGWILDADFPRITAGGTYRIYAHDLTNANAGLRGVRIPKVAGTEYFLEYRQLYTNRWMMNGVGLRWGNPDSWTSQLIDTTPGSASGKDDSAIVIGRTFSDAAANVHITPIGKGHTYPESVDVVVRLGSQAGNLPPTAVVAATATNVAAGVPVTFTATATDPNGDPLAYYWEFSNAADNVSTNNSPVQTVTFGSTGEYTARCVVSDMRGGLAQQTVVVRVGAPATFRISGHVLDNQNRPLVGIQVAAGSGASRRVAFSDSDGSYSIVGLAAGSYPVAAMDAVADSISFLRPYFASPVSVGPNFVTADFVGVPGQLNLYVTLVGKNATGWRYNDTGTDLGTAWRALGFNDSPWSTGTAPLGYPVGSASPVTTLVNSGPANNKYPTTYFRKQFSVANPAVYTNLLLELLRDDGAVVYLNGTEIARDNMPVGNIAYSTLASSSSGADAYLPTTVPITGLVAGNNVLAVEVHQSSPTSSDIVMDAGLKGLSVSNVTGLKLVYLAEPSLGARYAGPATVPLRANVLVGGTPATRVDYYANGVKVGESTSAPYSTQWAGATDGTHAMTAVALVAGIQYTSPVVSIVVATTPSTARLCSITSPSPGATILLPESVTISADAVAGPGLGVSRVEFFANGVKIGEDTTAPFSFTWVNPVSGEQSLTAIATDTAAQPFSADPVDIVVGLPPLGTALVSFGDAWRYRDNGIDPGPLWISRAYDDRTWASGASKLGYGTPGLSTVVSYGSNPNERHITTYFRKGFSLPGTNGIDGLLLQLIRDDAAVVYLNGFEIYRNNLLAGVVSGNSTALTSINSPADVTPVEVVLPSIALRSGTNVVAVEVHQVGPTSTDLAFNMSLTAISQTNAAGGLYLTSPAQGTRYYAPASIAVAAYVPGAAASPVEFFADGIKIGEDAAPPYAISWANPPSGTHVLTARAIVDGQPVASPAISIAVGSAPPTISAVAQTLIPVGANWRYFDSASAPAADWNQPEFSDAAWPTGNARFGHGWDGEVTPLTPGRTTHYFRRWFNSSNPSLYSRLLYRLVRDDGAVVYLNGMEVFRSNMPSGPINAGTPALSSVGTPDETEYFETALAAIGSGILSGSNLVAVELHQSAANSSDAGFDLAVSASGTTEARVYVGSPVQGSSVTYGRTLPIEVFASTGGIETVSAVEIFVNGASIGSVNVAPYRLPWTFADFGTNIITARMTTSLGSTVTADPVTVTVARELLSTQFIASGSTWKYLDTGANLGTTPTPPWAQIIYNDSTWLTGAARFGYGGDGEVTTLRSNRTDNSRILTFYFRKAFTVQPGATYTNLLFNLLRDDGAVVYLNGREVYRSNLPTGTITYTTPATNGVAGAEEQTFFPTTVTVTNLPVGTNVVAVEVHQQSTTSSDVGFDLSFQASGYTEDSIPPRLAITYRDGLVELSWPTTFVGWRVYGSTSLGPPWTPLSQTPFVVSGRYVIALSPGADVQYFRLGKP